MNRRVNLEIKNDNWNHTSAFGAAGAAAAGVFAAADAFFVADVVLADAFLSDMMILIKSEMKTDLKVEENMMERYIRKDYSYKIYIKELTRQDMGIFLLWISFVCFFIGSPYFLLVCINPCVP